jgi:tripartite ATP-independent transporter DctM subunit
MDAGIVTLLLFALMIFGLVSGLPIGFVLGSVGVVFTFFLWGPHAMGVIPNLIFGKAMMSFSLIAIPLFILMGAVLQESGMADRLFAAVHVWSGKVAGGLTVAAIIVCAIFAAMTGIGGAGTVTMGLIAVPAMLSRGYNKRMSLGAVGAGGALGILIPPSIIMIIYGMICQVSVGRLFAGGLVPGILLALMFCAYILIRCKIHPEDGPPAPTGGRDLTFKEKMHATLPVIPPLVLILVVLGSIFSGVATATEGSAIGAAGSLGLMVYARSLNWKVFRKISLDTLKYTGMVMWIIIGAYCFSTIYMALGADSFILEVIQNIPGGYWGVLIFIQILYFILGMLLDPGAIVMITAPLTIPIVDAMGYDPIWFGILFVINMQAAYISPPFGYNLFYLKAIAPQGTTMKDIYLAIIPFIMVQLLCLAVVMIFPQIALWLPNLIYGAQ